MKIEVLNGPVYQWDTGRKVKVVGENVTEVHFSLAYSQNALVTKPTDGVASIPSVLLQTGENLAVYIVCTNNDGQQTVARGTVYVNRRSKPDDYIYTEDEVFMYKYLERRVTALEKNYNVVDESLANNLSYLDLVDTVEFTDANGDIFVLSNNNDIDENASDDGKEMILCLLYDGYSSDIAFNVLDLVTGDRILSLSKIFDKHCKGLLSIITLYELSGSNVDITLNDVKTGNISADGGLMKPTTIQHLNNGNLVFGVLGFGGGLWYKERYIPPHFLKD